VQKQGVRAIPMTRQHHMLLDDLGGVVLDTPPERASIISGRRPGGVPGAESPVMTDARRMESLQWIRREGPGVRRALDEEASRTLGAEMRGISAPRVLRKAQKESLGV
jgi:hypothetical protein